MYVMAITIHLLISIVLCVVVLLQSSKGDGLAGAFGGGGAGQAVFGARGVTTILHKATIYLAIAFMVSSVALVFLTMREGGGSTSSIGQRAAERVPVGNAPAGSEQFVPVSPEDIPAADDELGADPGNTTGEVEGTESNAGAADSTVGGGE